MIFVTVGEQLPFDRLIRAIDQWAEQQHHKIFAQIGNSSYKPIHFEYKKFLDTQEFRQRLQEARVVVAHAGMGTIISALELGTPIIVMPRRAALGEHRNDHQLATAKRFQALQYVTVANDEKELWRQLDNMKKNGQEKAVRKNIGPSPLLISTIRDFVSV